MSDCARRGPPRPGATASRTTANQRLQLRRWRSSVVGSSLSSHFSDRFLRDRIELRQAFVLLQDSEDVVAVERRDESEQIESVPGVEPGTNKDERRHDLNREPAT